MIKKLSRIVRRIFSRRADADASIKYFFIGQRTIAWLQRMTRKGIGRMVHGSMGNCSTISSVAEPAPRVIEFLDGHIGQTAAAGAILEEVSSPHKGKGDRVEGT